MLYLEGGCFRRRREGAGRGKERKVNMIVAAGSVWHMIGPGRREVQSLGVVRQREGGGALILHCYTGTVWLMQLG